MYCYAPTFKKKKEKLICLLSVVAGLFLYLLPSFVPTLPMPGIFQILGIGCFVVMILVFSLCIAKHYTYSLEEGEDGRLDFIITERYGRRITVVCRVSHAAVQSATPVTEENRKDFSQKRTGCPVYRYTGVLFGEERYFLKLEEADESFYVEICANHDLISYLINH